MLTYFMALFTIAGLESMTFTDGKSGLCFFFFLADLLCVCPG